MPLALLVLLVPLALLALLLSPVRSESSLPEAGVGLDPKPILSFPPR